MPKITYLDNGGVRHDVHASAGTTVMEAAIQNGVPGIVAECGGFLSCATCHVYVDEAWFDRVAPADAEDGTESEMLDGTAAERLPTSRLSCQITVGDELDGLSVRIAPEQW